MERPLESGPGGRHSEENFELGSRGSDDADALEVSAAAQPDAQHKAGAPPPQAPQLGGSSENRPRTPSATGAQGEDRAPNSLGGELAAPQDNEAQGRPADAPPPAAAPAPPLGGAGPGRQGAAQPVLGASEQPQPVTVERGPDAELAAAPPAVDLQPALKAGAEAVAQAAAQQVAPCVPPPEAVDEEMVPADDLASEEDEDGSVSGEDEMEVEVEVEAAPEAQRPAAGGGAGAAAPAWRRDEAEADAEAEAQAEAEAEAGPEAEAEEGPQSAAEREPQPLQQLMSQNSLPAAALPPPHRPPEGPAAAVAARPRAPRAAAAPPGRPPQNPAPAAENRAARLDASVARNREEQAWLRDIPAAPVYSPTAAEWADPLAYIRAIQPQAALYGVCVVRAPLAPAAPPGALLQAFRFTTRQQRVRDAAWGADWEGGVRFGQRDKRYSLAEYQRAADEFARRRLGMAGTLPTPTVEAEYWRERAAAPGGGGLLVEYGNDVEGTAFHPGDPLGETSWNLNVSRTRRSRLEDAWRPHPPMCSLA
jgi:hypothetical protein